MKKYVRLPVRFETIRYPQQTAVYIWLGIDAVRDCSLGLALLKLGLINAFVVGTMDGLHKIDLQVSASTPTDRIQCNLSPDGISLRLTSNSVDYLLAMCLKYYRDGYAEVDHADLEATLEPGDEDAYITIKFADFAPPVSAEEAKRRLED